MEGNKTLYPPVPSNYVTIVDLQKRWMQQKQQQEEEEHIKKQNSEQTHNLNNKFVNNEDAKPHSQFQKSTRPKSRVNPNFKARTSFDGEFHRNKQAKEFRAVKKVSKSSEIDVHTANHAINNEAGGCVEKNSRFRNPNFPNSDRNPNYDNWKPFYRKFNNEKRLKEFAVVKKVSNTIPEESNCNVGVETTGIDDQKVEDDKKTKKKKKKMMNKRNKKKNQKVLDDCCVDEVREKQEKKLVVDQTVEEKDNQVIVENQTAGEKDSQVIVEDQTVEEKDNQVIVKDQTVEEKDCQVIVEDQTVEEKDNQVIVEDQTAEIELKLKKVSVSGLNGRSTTEIGGKRREYGGYNRGYRRDYGKRSWEVRRERNVAVDGIPEFGRSMAKFEGWRGVHRGYSKGEDRGKTYSRKDEQIWVKKNDVCVESCGN